MNSYAEIDGLPVAADRGLLTGLLRDEWGFTGTVVADYFAVRFLQTLHGVAEDAADAARLALHAGIDVELPTVDTFGTPLVEAVRRGEVDEALIDCALRRVLIQKIEIGLLDEGWQALPDDIASLRFDDEVSQDVAVRLAGSPSSWCATPASSRCPPAAGSHSSARSPTTDGHARLLLVPQPRGRAPRRLRARPGHPLAARRGWPDASRCSPTSPVRHHRRGHLGHPGGRRRGHRRPRVRARRRRPGGMFGRGTSGEGCDAADLRLPGVQADLVRAVLATGTPVVLVLMTGRPYALGPEFDGAAAVVQAFFLGQLGGQALAEVLTGMVNPPGGCRSAFPGRGRNAEHLPGTAARPAQQGLLDRPDPGVPVRPRAELHHLRVVRRHARRAGGRDGLRAGGLAGRRRGARADHRGQHR
ncbi:glycoside hydrolase family 3 protein [Micromonospora sp. M12]